jgi:hypothetical protein
VGEGPGVGANVLERKSLTCHSLMQTTGRRMHPTTDPKFLRKEFVFECQSQHLPTRRKGKQLPSLAFLPGAVWQDKNL